jgi:hypothetical protein
VTIGHRFIASRTALHLREVVGVVLGDAPEEIAATATDVGARLIVLTLRKGHGLFGRRQGAITYRVLCSGAVPVLALRQGSRPARNR